MNGAQGPCQVVLGGDEIPSIEGCLGAIEHDSHPLDPADPEFRLPVAAEVGLGGGTVAQDVFDLVQKNVAGAVAGVPVEGLPAEILDFLEAVGKVGVHDLL